MLIELKEDLQSRGKTACKAKLKFAVVVVALANCITTIITNSIAGKLSTNVYSDVTKPVFRRFLLNLL